MEIRPHAPDDSAAIAEICIATAVVEATDHAVLVDLYAHPYLTFQPQFCFVAVDESGVCGYVLGTDNTEAYVEWFRRVWLPDRPHPQTDSGWSTQFHHPENQVLPELARYPAHLHINLLPQAQGHGVGQLLIGRFLHAVAAPVHLGMSADNHGAGRFYRRLGFTPIPVDGQPATRFFGRAEATPVTREDGWSESAGA